MKRLPALLLLVLALPGFAADDFKPPSQAELQMKDVPWAPGASAVVLEWNVRHNDEESRGHEYHRIKILTEEGKKHGDVVIPFIPGKRGVTAIKARTIRADGTIVPFDGKIYEKVVAKGRGLRILQKTFTFPQVEPGAILEYRFTRTWPGTELNAERWVLQRDIPVARATFWIKPYSRVASVCALIGVPTELKPRRDGEVYVADVENVAAFIEEPFAPPDEEIKARMELYYTGKDPGHYWHDTGKIASRIIEDFIGNRGGIRKAATELIAGATDDIDKLRRLYAQVQQLENTTFAREKTEQEERREKRRDPRHIEDVLRDGYGSRDALNRLFAGLAAAAGFDAHIVLVSSRDRLFFNKRIPDFSQIPEEVVLVRLGGVDRYFDPGTPFAPFGLLVWDNTGVDGLRVEWKSGGQWLVTQEQGATTASTRRVAKLRLEDDLLKGSVRVTYGGQDALLERLAALREDEATSRKRIEDGAKSWFPDGSTVKLTKIESATTADAPLEHHFDVELAHIGTTTGSRIVVPLSVFTSKTRNVFSAETRKYDIYFPYSRQVNDSVTLELPEGYAIENVPAGTTLDEKVFRFGSTWKKEAKAVTFERSMTRGGLLIAAVQYPKVRNFFSRVATADQEAVVLRKAN
ncbi:MAG TPA: DUF3857 domain-containing protein [Thermoanaerobaculia bacterium]|jgi:hypothetical protein